MQYYIHFRRGFINTFVGLLLVVYHLNRYFIRIFFAKFSSSFFRHFKKFRSSSIIMRYAAAYVLAVLAGNTSPDATSISKILGSVGIDCDNTKAQKVIDACKGKDVEQIIAEGTKKLSSLPAGGGAVAASPSAAAPADAKKGGAKEEPKKEEKKKDESDEEGDDMVCILNKIKPVFKNSFLFRVLVYLINLNKKQNKLSLNFYQTNSHHHHSYLFLLCVCVFCIDLL